MAFHHRTQLTNAYATSNQPFYTLQRKEIWQHGIKFLSLIKCVKNLAQILKTQLKFSFLV